MKWKTDKDGKVGVLDKALDEADCEGLLYKVDTPTSLPSSTVSQEASLNRMDRIVTESELDKLSRCLHADFYTTVAIKLGVGYGEHRNIKKLNPASFIDANLEMLMHWRQKKGGKVRDLDKALDEAGCGGLSYKVDTPTSLPSSTVSQEASLNRMDRIVTESELDKLSRCLPADLYTTVAIKLGVGYGEHRYIKRQNTASFIDANFEMLMHWRHKEDGGKMRDLDKALEEAGCEGLLYKVDTPTSLPSSTVSQEASLNRMDRIVTESELCKLARCLPADLYTTVAIKLGVGYGEHRNIKKQNTASFIDANFEMLMHWRHEKDGGKVRDLDKALDEADCGGLSYKDM